MFGFEKLFIFLIWCSLLLSISLSYDLLDHNRNDFIERYQAYYPACSAPNSNIVLPRYDNYNLDLNESRPWSMNSPLIRSFVGIDTSDISDTVAGNPTKKQKPRCKSAQEVQLSASYSMKDHKCQLAWYSPKQVCHILHEYSLIYWIGDSLTRHQFQALRILMTGDYRYGGTPAPQKYEVYSNCSCDGQFSENELCRMPMQVNKNQFSIFNYESIISYGFCSNYKHPNNSQTQLVWAQNSYKLIQLSCPVEDSSIGQRPIFIFFQGGHHAELSSEFAISTYFIPLLNRLRGELQNCWDRVRLVFSGATVCADEVVKKYPHQNKEYVHSYNTETAKWLYENYPQVISLDFWNLSAEALDHTSDGFHMLTDVNLIKATTVLNLMHQMV
jgi:hypothetical protein